MSEETLVSDLPPPPAAPPPFNDPDADLIIRTSDNVNFRVFQSIMRMTSGVFRDMLTMPVPSPGEHPSSETVDGIHVVQIDEKSSLLEKLLRFYYPASLRIRFETPLEALEFYKIADKYMIDGAQALVKEELVAFTNKPMTASYTVRLTATYAVACALGLQEEAKLIARQCLRFSLTELTEGRDSELERTPALVLQKLYSYYLQCRQAVVAATDPCYWAAQDLYEPKSWRPPETWDPSPFSVARRFHCSVALDKMGCMRDPRPGYVRSWFLVLLDILRDGINARPLNCVEGRDETITRVMAEAIKCNICAPEAYGIISRYMQLVSDQAKGNH